jgi:hypothetical protein
MSVPLSLRARLLALVLLALLPAFVLIIYNALQDKRRTVADVKSTARRLVRFATRNHEQLIDDAHDLRAFLSRLPFLLLDPQACPAPFADLSKRYSNFTNFLGVDLHGSVTCRTQPEFIVEDGQLRREIA